MGWLGPGLRVVEPPMAVWETLLRAPELGVGELKVDLGWARAKKGELTARIEKLRPCLLSLLRMPGKAMETRAAPTP